jgi:hypothetical protein
VAEGDGSDQVNDSETSDSESVEGHKETPVLDVHPPHAAVHTWKDFFIHLATITIGLLIALSLEQSVVWAHHLRQRHRLEADLQEEGMKDRALVEDDVRFLEITWAVNAARLRELESVLAGRSKSVPPFPAGSFAAPEHPKQLLFVMPSAAVWTTAKDGALLDLLPQEMARRYERLYLQVEYLKGREIARREAGRLLEADSCRFGDGTMPCVADLTRMSVEQLEEHAGLLTRYFTATREEKARLLIFGALNQLILDGRSIDDQALAAEYEYNLSDSHPDVFLK